MPSNGVVRISDYRVKKKSEVESIEELNQFDYFSSRFDKLEEMISPKEEVLRAKEGNEHDIPRVLALFISTIIMGASICLAMLSFWDVISIGWQYFAAIAFASGGLSAASFMILIGVDHEQYK